MYKQPSNTTGTAILGVSEAKPVSLPNRASVISSPIQNQSNASNAKSKGEKEKQSLASPGGQPTSTAMPLTWDFIGKTTSQGYAGSTSGADVSHDVRDRVLRNIQAASRSIDRKVRPHLTKDPDEQRTGPKYKLQAAPKNNFLPSSHQTGQAEVPKQTMHNERNILLEDPKSTTDHQPVTVTSEKEHVILTKPSDRSSPRVRIHARGKHTDHYVKGHGPDASTTAKHETAETAVVDRAAHVLAGKGHFLEKAYMPEKADESEKAYMPEKTCTTDESEKVQK